MPKSQYVLSLYRQMLRKGRQLQYTDKEFYFRRIRNEVEKARDLVDKAQIDHQIKKAEAFLKNDRIL